jgi:protein-S-isoprenylcysteine O-methyltransferase Ste14
MHTVATDRDRAGVIAPPPAIFLAAWSAAAVLHRIVPIRIVAADGGLRRLVGGAALAAGVCLSALVVRRFAKAATPVSPLSPTSALVLDGPYRFSRNPDYIGQTLIYTGAAFIGNRRWPLLLMPAVLALITRGVIEREEHYLERRFGAAYRNYLERVPRWA